ncbi:MAG: hypothetical protein CMC96_11090 [Flavobacteriales bacterium]|nr:hypothetical protein [Flavobacteriales bacterium]
MLSLLFSIDEKSKQNPPAFHEPVHRRAGILGLFPNLSLPLLNGDDFSDLQRFTLELLQSLAPFSSFHS